MELKENQPNDCLEFKLSLTNLFWVWKSVRPTEPTWNSNVAGLLVLVFSWKGYPVYSSLHTLMMISNNIITHFFIHRRGYLASFFDKTLYSHAKKDPTGSYFNLSPFKSQHYYIQLIKAIQMQEWRWSALAH